MHLTCHITKLSEGIPPMMHSTGFPIYLQNQDVTEAEQLMAEHGAQASYEAAARARKSRNLGNHINFCRWRQIERFLKLMSEDVASGTVH